MDSYLLLKFTQHQIVTVRNHRLNTVQLTTFLNASAKKWNLAF